MIDLIIFDFDGTLADTEGHSLSIYNALALKYGYRTFSQEEVEELKKLPPSKIISAARIPYTDLFKVLKEGQILLKKHMDEISAYNEDIKAVIEELKGMTGRVGIISSNLIINIKSFLKKYDVDMDFIVSSPLFSKELKIHNAVKKFKTKPERSLYVGDELRDIISSRKAGVKIAAATWGYNSRCLLEEARPDYLTDDIAQLIPIVKNLNGYSF